MKLNEGSAVEMCREAKLKPFSPSVLIMTERAEDVPDVLAAGCDGVLMKPFSPSLLINRVSRMLRIRSEQLRLQAARSRNKAAHLLERTALLKMGTNRNWPSVVCPYCSHQGVTSFDYSSSRRAWSFDPSAGATCHIEWMGRAVVDLRSFIGRCPDGHAPTFGGRGQSFE